MAIDQSNREQTIFDPISEDCLKCPLVYLRHEHQRQLAVCRYFREKTVFAGLCEGEAPEDIRRLYTFLTDQLPRHVRDEEQGLFPVLLRQSNDEKKEIQEVVRFLRREQEFDRDMTDFVLADLDILFKGRKLVNSLRLELNLETLLDGLCRHANWEADRLFPIAERVLSTEAKQEIICRMLSWR